MQNYIVMRNLKCIIQNDGCVLQITHRDVILRTHGPKYSHSNCAFRIQIAHFALV